MNVPKQPHSEMPKRVIYVALLRGINVGGNNIISMKALKERFVAMRFDPVATYINSGNVIFGSPSGDARMLERRIERMLRDDFRLDIRVVVRSLADMEALVASFPRAWNGDKAWRYYVVFLRHAIDSPDIVARLQPKDSIEKAVYAHGAILWAARVADLTKTRVVKLPAQEVYQQMTVRNDNTTRKLAALMRRMQET